MRMVEDIIIKPIITEASMDMLDAKKYVFKVQDRATKADIATAVEATRKALIVLPEMDATVIKSCANIPGVVTAQYNTVNVYDVLNADKFIIAKDAVAKLEEVYA